MIRQSILVVDDALASRTLFQKLLTREGFEVRTSANADQARAALDDFLPDLALVDVILPGGNGLDLLRRWKEDPATKNMPVVVLSACTLRSDIEKAALAGCDGYISKPIDPRTFSSLVRSFLKPRKTTDEEASRETAPAEK
jgi:DNA-binding response OmpR family regulator